MGILDINALKQTAGARLDGASYPYRKLVLIHTGAALAVSFLITLLNFILTRQIDTTGGLSGLQTRSVLETARTVMQYGFSLLLPFWEISLLFVALGWAREHEPSPDSLSEGFRRFGPVLRWMLLEAAAIIAMAIVCAYVSTGVFMMTPLAQPLMEIMLPMMDSASVLDQSFVMDEAALAAASSAMTPVLIIFFVLFCGVCIPFLYRLRFSGMALMDEDHPGAIRAVMKSWKLTRGHCLQLVKLDLSFWWFYALQGLFVLISYGDVLLEAVGIHLPLSKDTGFFVFYALQVLCQLALYWWAAGRVQTTYALAYDTLAQTPSVPAVTAPPKHQPWNY